MLIYVSCICIYVVSSLQSTNAQVRVMGATLMYNCGLALPKDESDLLMEWTSSLCMALQVI